MGRIVCASAPGRCGIIGNPSDIYGGFVVSCTVPARAQVRLTEGVTQQAGDDMRLWNAASRRFPLEGDWRAEWRTTIPRSSGLSGSTALLSAMVACLLAARSEESLLESGHRTALAELVRDIERNAADIMCGFQDATTISHGGLVAMDFAGKHPVLPGPQPTVHRVGVPADLPCLLITTGVERLSGSVHGPMSERWLAGESAVVEGISRIAELGRRGADAIRKADWHALAVAMQENQTIVARLGGSGDEVDQLVQACMGQGAMAAKLAGAGMGGTVIALTLDPDDLERRLRSEGYSRFLRPVPVEGTRLEDATISW